MFLKISEMLGGATNLLRSVANVTGSNAIADSLDDALSTLKSQSDGVASNLDGVQNRVQGVGQAADDMKDIMKD